MMDFVGGPAHGQQLSIPEVKEDGDVIYVSKTADVSGALYTVLGTTATWVDPEA